jgi:GT2 family glycosyltransferase
MRLSVILPTVRAWPELAEPLAATVAQRFSDTFEVLVLDGHGAGLASQPEPPVRWIREPGADVFRLRALGAAESRGELILFSEDHCVATPDWFERTSAAHRRTPAAALIGPVSNHPASSVRAVDRANYALTLGPFAPPLDRVPGWRLPVPTNLSIKRDALPAVAQPSGWLEYEFLAEAMRQGSIAIAADAELHHLQSWSVPRALAVHFQSGRSYGASVREWPAGQRRAWWRAMPGAPRHLYRSTAPVLSRHAAGARSSDADRLWLASLVLANAAGQVVGAVAGAGSSRRWLV